MEAIILAGGFGKRLRSVINNCPKPMAPINGIPFLEILLRNLSKKGFKKIILSLYYQSNVITNYFNSKYLGMEIIYAIEEKPLGTGGAILNSLEFVDSDHFYVFNGDSFVDLNFEDTEELWEKYKSNIVVLTEVADKSRYGNVILKGKNISEFKEKSGSGRGLINSGIYILNKNLFDKKNIPKAFSFENDFLNYEVKDNTIFYYINNGIFIDIGIPSDYEKAQILLKKYGKH